MKKYDFVLVGAGAAGCLLAKRLADQGFHVAILESGESFLDEEPAMVYDPMLYSEAFGTDMNWRYHTIRQKNLNNRAIRCTRGRGVGGTTLINGMMWNRCAIKLYEEVGISQKMALKLMCKHENNAALSNHHPYHTPGGEHIVTGLNEIPQDQVSPVAFAYMKSCEALGFRINPDYNGETQEGVSLLQVSISPDRKRVSEGPCFLKSSSVHIFDRCHVKRLVIEPSNIDSRIRVTGVIYSKKKDGSDERVLSPTKEVILCGGAIGSPFLLMLSGIGPKEHLKSKGVKVHYDLPGVGSNLRDHPRFSMKYKINISLDCSKFFSHVESHLYCYSKLCSPNDKSNKIPDLQIVQDHVLRNSDLLEEPPLSSGFNIKPNLVRPYSHGTVRLKNSMWNSKPLIDPGYLSDRRDLLRLIEGVKICRELVQKEGLKDLVIEEIKPGKHIASEEQIESWLRKSVDTGYHIIGTCKMGSDSMAVVDEQFRVHGTDGLRVIDSSVFRTLPNGNTTAPTLLLAERGASVMIQNYKSSKL